MINAKLEGRIIDASEGVDLRDSCGAQLDFRCEECGEAARVFRAGGHMPARFEHVERNDHCSLVHHPKKSRLTRGVRPAIQT